MPEAHLKKEMLSLTGKGGCRGSGRPCLLQGEAIWAVLNKTAWVKLVSLLPVSRNCQGFLSQNHENSRDSLLLCSGTQHLVSPKQLARPRHIPWPALHQHRQWQAQAELRGGSRASVEPVCPLPVRQQNTERGTWCPLLTTGCQEGRIAVEHWGREGTCSCPLWLSGAIATCLQHSEAEAVGQRIYHQPRLHRDCGKTKQNPTVLMHSLELCLPQRTGLSPLLLLETHQTAEGTL